MADYEDTEGMCIVLKTEGDTLYVCDGWAGLKVYHTDFDSSLCLVSSFRMEGSAWKAELISGFVLVADSRMYVIDISNPFRPREFSVFDLLQLVYLKYGILYPLSRLK